MISQLILAAALCGGCQGNACTVETTVTKEVTKHKVVAVLKDVEPVRKLVVRWRERERIVFRNR